MNRRAQTHERYFLLRPKVWVDDTVDDDAPNPLREHYSGVRNLEGTRAGGTLTVEEHVS